MDPDVDSNSHNLEAAYNEAVQVISDAQKRVSHLTKDKGSAAVDEAVAAVAKAERYLQDWGHSLLSGAQDAHGASMGTLQEVMQKFKQVRQLPGSFIQAKGVDHCVSIIYACVVGVCVRLHGLHSCLSWCSIGLQTLVAHASRCCVY